MEIDVGARSDAGRVRENNEDSFRVVPGMSLFVLSDGMGGQASGEVASRMAVDTIVSHCREAGSNLSSPLVGGSIAGVSETTNRLASALRAANRAVHAAAQRSEGHRGMGATAVAAWFTGERMSLAHVGDSRAYILRGEQLEQLTKDHSFVAEQVRRGMMTPEEASASRMQNVLIRALGIDPEVEVDVDEELLMEGETLLLCSDGLTHELSDAQIAAVLRDPDNAHEAATRLIDLANEAGGRDNTTVIVLRRVTKPAGLFARIGRWFKGSNGSSPEGGR